MQKFYMHKESYIYTHDYNQEQYITEKCEILPAVLEVK